VSNDPFTLVKAMAETLGLSAWQATGLLALVACIIGFSITSLMAGKPMRAFRILATGFAIIMFFLFSLISGAVNGI
jgi:hypothetical protein